MRCARTIAVLLLCVLAVGCYEHVTRGNVSIYGFAWWLGPCVIVAGIAGIPVGWRFRQTKWGFVLLILAPVLLVIVAPAMYSDRVLIDDDHFEVRYGFWFSPTVHNLRFADLSDMRYVAVAGNRGRTNYELHCRSKTGVLTVVHAGDLVFNTVPEIMARASAKGVAVANLTP